MRFYKTSYRRFIPIFIGCFLVSFSTNENKSFDFIAFQKYYSLDQSAVVDSIKGKLVLIDFWASWCGPCRKELPKLEDLHQKYKDLGVTIIGINVDVDPELSKILLKDHPVTFMVLYDPENNVSADYDIQAMPSTFLVDKNGLLRFRHNGYLAGYEHKYDAQIKQLLRE